MNIREKLTKIQNELNAPKNQYNKFGGYAYRNCEDILEAVKPLLNKYNTSLTITDTIESVADRIYVKATATLWDAESEDCISTNAYAREAYEKKGLDLSQLTGATSSYARKYCLNGLFCIDDGKDADTEEHKKETEKKCTIEQQIIIRDAYGDKLPSLLQRHGLNSLEEMSLELASSICKKLKERSNNG